MLLVDHPMTFSSMFFAVLRFDMRDVSSAIDTCSSSGLVARAHGGVRSGGAIRPSALPAAPAPEQPTAGEKTGWEDVPRDLDALLAEERVDEAAGARYFKDAESFLEKRQIEGTSVVGATCGGSLCRIDFENDSSDTFKEFRMQFAFLPWEGTSNYFSATPADKGPWKSFIWLGRDGFDLPLEELRQANANRP